MKKILSVVAGIAILIFCMDRARKFSDFDVFLSAGKALLASQDLYNKANTLDVQYFYSPFFAIIMAPLSCLPFFIVKLIWLLFSVFCLYRIWTLFQQQYNIGALTARQRILWVLVAHALVGGFIMYNFHVVQVTFFMLWATVESIYLISRSKYIQGALLLGLAINFKLLPLIFIPYLFYRNYWKGGLLCLTFVGILLLLPYLFLNDDYHSFLLDQWWDTINPLNEEHTLELERTAFDIPALIASIFTTAEGDLTASFGFIHLAITVVRGIFILLTLYFLATWPFKKAQSPMHKVREIAYLLLVTTLIFPHQNQYVNIYLIPAYAYILFYLLAAWKNRDMLRPWGGYVPVIALLVLGILLQTVTGRSIVGDEVYVWLSRHKSITIGTICLVPVLMILKPADINRLVHDRRPRMAKAISSTLPELV